MLVECISANTLLKKTVHNQEQEIAQLKSNKLKEEQMDLETINEESTLGKGLKQFNMLLEMAYVRMCTKFALLFIN